MRSLRLGISASCLALALPAWATASSLRAPRLTVPPVTTPSYLAALQLDLRGDHRGAAEAYSSAPNASVPRARFHHKMSEQIAALLDSVRRSPDSYDDHFNLGVNLQNKYWALYLDLGVRSELHTRLAEHHFKESIRLQPQAANPLVCLAALYAQQGDRPRAREVAKAISSRETRPMDVYNIAFYHKVVGEIDEAFRLLRQALQYDRRHREWIRDSDDFAEYLDDPRMKALLEEPVQPAFPRAGRQLYWGRLQKRAGGLGRLIPLLKKKQPWVAPAPQPPPPAPVPPPN